MMWRFVAAGLVAASWPAYARRIRPWILTWGSTASEATARLPGDELLEQADGVATRAIEINAPASAVWPWIAQMGPAARGGAYTYDWIENLLGLDMHSTDRVLPEFQHPQVGQVIGYGANRMCLERVEPERVLAWRSEDGNWVWSFVLLGGEGVTRLISRNRFRLPTLIARLGMLPMEPASLLMERKMLLGIKQRAERLTASSSEPARPMTSTGTLVVTPRGTGQPRESQNSSPPPSDRAGMRSSSASPTKRAIYRHLTRSCWGVRCSTSAGCRRPTSL